MHAPNTSPDANTDFAEDETRPNSVRVRDLFLRTIHTILANFKNSVYYIRQVRICLELSPERLN